MKSRIPEMIGNKFGMLLVIEPRQKHPGRTYILCLCDCGKYTMQNPSHVRLGRITSCGCGLIIRNLARATHKHSPRSGITPEYRAWKAMKSRCTNSNIKHYSYYGGRGVRVCDEWMDSFEEFFNHIGPRPSSKHSVDRYPNNDGNYEPGNVRWATKREQVLNRKKRK